nr:hypothetical protein Iba_chr09fCG5210 [Ipomoea batatas]
MDPMDMSISIMLSSSFMSVKNSIKQSLELSFSCPTKFPLYGRRHISNRLSSSSSEMDPSSEPCAILISAWFWAFLGVGFGGLSAMIAVEMSRARDVMEMDTTLWPEETIAKNKETADGTRTAIQDLEDMENWEAM